LLRLPWGVQFEKDTFVSPEFTSLDVLAFCSGSLPLGICLPNYDEVRTNIGFKNVDLGNVCTARSDNTYNLFLDSEDSKLFCLMYARADQVLTGLHELIGHGSGKLLQKADDGSLNYEASDDFLNPVTGCPVTSHYLPGQTYGSVFGSLSSALEECRAECVSLYLGTASDVQEIFGFVGQDAHDSIYAGWLGMCWRGLKSLEHYDPANGWGAVHGRARFAILRVLLEVSSKSPQPLLRLEWSEDSDGPNVVLRMDRGLIETVGRPAIGSLLLGIHVARCTADKVLAGEFERLTRVDEDYLPLWELVRRRQQPKEVFVQPSTSLAKDGAAELKSYPATREGMLESFVDHWPGLS